MTEADFVKLEEMFGIGNEKNIEIVTELMKTKQDMNNIVNKFVTKVVQLKLTSESFLGRDETKALFCSIDDVHAKQRLFESLENMLKVGYADPLSGCFSPSCYQQFFSDADNMLRRESDLAELGIMVDTIKESGADSVMFIDLNNFKLINDTSGHYAGDVCISKIGKKLLSYDKAISVRRSGDEFVVFGEKKLLENIKGDLASEKYIEDLNSHVKKDVCFNGLPARTSVSAGISTLEIPSLLENVVSAMNARTIFQNAIEKAEEAMLVEKQCFKEKSGDYRSLGEKISLLSENEKKDLK
jgi:diguanylate cyclase (GGDEF)-like protein